MFGDGFKLLESKLARRDILKILGLGGMGVMALGGLSGCTVLKDLIPESDSKRSKKATALGKNGKNNVDKEFLKRKRKELKEAIKRHNSKRKNQKANSGCSNSSGCFSRATALETVDSDLVLAQQIATDIFDHLEDTGVLVEQQQLILQASDSEIQQPIPLDSPIANELMEVGFTPAEVDSHLNSSLSSQDIASAKDLIASQGLRNALDLVLNPTAASVASGQGELSFGRPLPLTNDACTIVSAICLTTTALGGLACIFWGWVCWWWFRVVLVCIWGVTKACGGGGTPKDIDY